MNKEINIINTPVIVRALLSSKVKVAGASKVALTSEHISSGGQSGGKQQFSAIVKLVMPPFNKKMPKRVNNINKSIGSLIISIFDLIVFKGC